MDALQLSDHLEDCWSDWHLSFDNQVMYSSRPCTQAIGDPLPVIDNKAESALAIFDQWNPSRDLSIRHKLDGVGVYKEIGSSENNEDPNFERYGWCPTTIISSILTRVKNIFRFENADFTVNDVYALIRDCFVRSMAYRGIHLDESIRRHNGLEDVSSVVTLKPGVQPNADQEKLIWDTLAMITYGFLVEAYRTMVQVPFEDGDIEIDADRKEASFTGSLHEYLRAWSSGMAPHIRQGDGNLWQYARFNNRVVGFASGFVGDVSRRYDSVRVGGLVVGENYRRRGLGGKLIRGFEQSLPAHVRRLDAEAVVSSLPFWLSQGFADKGASWNYSNCNIVEKAIHREDIGGAPR